MLGKIERKLGTISYTYRGKSKGGEVARISKRVTFFLLRYLEGEVYGHDYEVDEARWFPIEEALRAVRFATEKKMIGKAHDLYRHPGPATSGG